MAEISDAQLGVIDDALTAIQQGLGDQSQSPEAQQIMQMIVSAQQVVSSLKGETAGDTGAPAGNSSQSISAALAGGAPAMTMEMCMASGRTQEECQAMMQQQQMMGQPQGGSEVYSLLADSIGQVLDTLESKLGGAEGQPEIWNKLAATENYLRALGGAAYPWDQCMSDQMSQYGSEETAKRVCGC